MGQIDDWLRDRNHKEFICWNCKSELSREEIITVEKGYKLSLELCFECYMDEGK
ncbi:hypothetical protein LCL89_15850 [Halobacillus yeomjeoni]|uniref:hypothetical protein n=1 Tax=Halobacillus yeomjeoni TaxID=311194 RepID=UPI001CD79EE3|nr:hypothetical protein [Halobacillus yeomjeoni]MCA0985510.1 hypothetical protein [Halobacillus yeomjeoni]